METANVIALAGFGFVLLVQAGAIVWWARGVSAIQNGHGKALEALPETLKAFVTQETGKGYQAQLDRLERSDAECDGKISSMRQEFDGRFERAGARITASEQSQATQNAAVSAALTKLEATMTAMKEAIDRLAEAERERHRAPATAQPDLLTTLNMIAQIKPLMKQLAP